jgi:hypothetical protein
LCGLADSIFTVTPLSSINAAGCALIHGIIVNSTVFLAKFIKKTKAR